MLKAVGGRHILARMLRNLKNIYASGADWPRSLAALDRILILEPRATDDMLERAALYETAGMLRRRARRLSELS